MNPSRVIHCSQEQGISSTTLFANDHREIDRARSCPTLTAVSNGLFLGFQCLTAIQIHT